jgi:hypothetical protein
MVSAEESAENIIYQRFQASPVLPLSLEEAYIVTTSGVLRQESFAKAQVYLANHYIELLGKVSLPTNISLLRELCRLRSEWRDVLYRIERDLYAKREAEQRRHEREMHYLKAERIISELRAIGAYRDADEFEEKLRHEQLLDQMKTKK